MVGEVEKGVPFRVAVLDMGALFKQMKREFGVPPAITIDIVRLQLLYMQQNQQPANMNQPIDPNATIDEVIEGEVDAIENFDDFEPQEADEVGGDPIVADIVEKMHGDEDDE